MASSSQPESPSSFLPGNLSSRNEVQQSGVLWEARWSPARERRASFCWTEVTQCWAGPLTCGHGFPEPQGTHPGNRPCSLALSSAPSRGSSSPLLFSTVAAGSQVPRTSLKTGCFQCASLFTSCDEWWGDCELCVEKTFYSISGLFPYDRLNDLF